MSPVFLGSKVFLYWKTLFAALKNISQKEEKAFLPHTGYRSAWFVLKITLTPTFLSLCVCAHYKNSTSKKMFLNPVWKAQVDCQKSDIFKIHFLSNLYYGDLDKYIRKFLRYCCQLLDKPSRSYEQKTKIKLNLAEIIAEFTNFNSVWQCSTVSDTVKIREFRYDFGQI